MESDDEPLRLITPGRLGVHRSSLLRRVRKGELLRLRRGVFAPSDQWRRTKPWARHLALAAAHSMANPSRVFCRETALVLHGVPVLSVPREVHLRARSQSEVGAAAPSALTGMPIRHCGLAGPRGIPSVQAYSSYRDPVAGIPALKVPVPGVVDARGAPIHVFVETLPFVLVDTVPRMDAESAVTALDAVEAGRHRGGSPVAPQAFMAFEPWLRTKKAAAAWDWAYRFADGRSESPGESRSRVLIHRLGFQPPELQRSARLPNGAWVRFDFSWEDGQIVGEFDGRIKYNDARQLSGTDDRGVYWAQVRREEGIRDTGRRVVRWGWEDLAAPRVMERKLLREGVPRRRRR